MSDGQLRACAVPLAPGSSSGVGRVAATGYAAPRRRRALPPGATTGATRVAAGRNGAPCKIMHAFPAAPAAPGTPATAKRRALPKICARRGFLTAARLFMSETVHADETVACIEGTRRVISATPDGESRAWTAHQAGQPEGPRGAAAMFRADMAARRHSVPCKERRGQELPAPTSAYS